MSLSPEDMALALPQNEGSIRTLLLYIKWASAREQRWSEGDYPPGIHTGRTVAGGIIRQAHPCTAKGAGLAVGLIGKRCKFNIFTTAADNLGIEIQIHGPNGERCWERIATEPQPTTNKGPSSPSRNERNVWAGMGRKRPTSDARRPIVRQTNVSTNALTKKRILLDHQIIGEGHFLISYVPRSAGIHTITIKFNGETILGSPFSVYIAENVNSLNPRKSGSSENSPYPRDMSYDMKKNRGESTVTTPVISIRNKQSLAAINAMDTLESPPMRAAVLAHTSTVHRSLSSSIPIQVRAQLTKQATVTRRRVLRRVFASTGQEVALQEVSASPNLRSIVHSTPERRTPERTGGPAPRPRKDLDLDIDLMHSATESRSTSRPTSVTPQPRPEQSANDMAKTILEEVFRTIGQRDNAVTSQRMMPSRSNLPLEYPTYKSVNSESRLPLPTQEEHVDGVRNLGSCSPSLPPRPTAPTPTDNGTQLEATKSFPTSPKDTLAAPAHDDDSPFLCTNVWTSNNLDHADMKEKLLEGGFVTQMACPIRNGDLYKNRLESDSPQESTTDLEDSDAVSLHDHTLENTTSSSEAKYSNGNGERRPKLARSRSPRKHSSRKRSTRAMSSSQTDTENRHTTMSSTGEDRMLSSQVSSITDSYELGLSRTQSPPKNANSATAFLDLSKDDIQTDGCSKPLHSTMSSSGAVSQIGISDVQSEQHVNVTEDNIQNKPSKVPVTKPYSGLSKTSDRTRLAPQRSNTNPEAPTRSRPPSLQRQRSADLSTISSSRGPDSPSLKVLQSESLRKSCFYISQRAIQESVGSLKSQSSVENTLHDGIAGTSNSPAHNQGPHGKEGIPPRLVDLLEDSTLKCALPKQEVTPTLRKLSRRLRLSMSVPVLSKKWTAFEIDPDDEVQADMVTKLGTEQQRPHRATLGSMDLANQLGEYRRFHSNPTEDRCYILQVDQDGFDKRRLQGDENKNGGVVQSRPTSHIQEPPTMLLASASLQDSPLSGRSSPVSSPEPFRYKSLDGSQAGGHTESISSSNDTANPEDLQELEAFGKDNPPSDNTAVQGHRTNMSNTLSILLNNGYKDSRPNLLKSTSDRRKSLTINVPKVKVDRSTQVTYAEIKLETGWTRPHKYVRQIQKPVSNTRDRLSISGKTEAPELLSSHDSKSNHVAGLINNNTFQIAEETGAHNVPLLTKDVSLKDDDELASVQYALNGDVGTAMDPNRGVVLDILQPARQSTAEMTESRTAEDPGLTSIKNSNTHLFDHQAFDQGIGEQDTRINK